MNSIRVTYDGQQHCTATHETKRTRVATDACVAAGGRGEELSPGELVASGLAGCMLLSMGIVADREGLDITGTEVDVAIRFQAEGARIEAIELVFDIPLELEPRQRSKLEAAADACPIKHSFHPDVALLARFRFQTPVCEVPACPC